MAAISRPRREERLVSFRGCFARAGANQRAQNGARNTEGPPMSYAERIAFIHFSPRVIPWAEHVTVGAATQDGSARFICNQLRTIPDQ